MQSLLKSLILIVSLLFTSQICATHIIGGDFSTVQTGPNTFDINLKIYRDCGQGNSTLVSPAIVSVYDNVTNVIILQFDMTSDLVSQSVLSLGDSCNTLMDICVEEYIFISSISLPNNPNGYYIEWHECCRNLIIDNLAIPGSDGKTFYIQIPDPAISSQNSSPDFGNYPTDGYLCIGIDQEIDFNITDPDSDSLVFSLIEPYDEDLDGKPFTTCVWASGFSLSNILGNVSQTPMSIDSETGIISCHPEISGIFVFAIMVEEYRNGILIGEVTRDVEYKSIYCSGLQIVVDSVHNEVFGYDGEIHISVLGNSTYAYDWSNGDATQDITGLGDGNYFVSVTDLQTGCIDTLTIPVSSTVSVNTIEGNNDNILVYPNPTIDVITLAIIGNKTPKQVQILDISGKVVYLNKKSTSFDKIDLSKLEKGVYLIKILIENETYLEKIVKL